MTFTDKNNSLVIRQSPVAQREIQALLAKLRQERRFPTTRRTSVPARTTPAAPRVEAPVETPEP